MAAPVYGTDLTTLAVANTGTDTGTWDESSNSAWDDGGGPVDEPDFYIEGSASISAQFTKTGVGTIMYDSGSNITLTTDDAILIWSFWASPPSLQTYANGGVRTIVGATGFGAFDAYPASGSNFDPNPIGGWTLYAVAPQNATVDAAATVVGGGNGGTYRTIGTAINASAQARGQPHAVDAIRYGRAQATYINGEVADPAKFDGWSTWDNSVSTRNFGLLQLINGAYKQQGLVSLGTTATAVYFSDANKTIAIANTPMVSPNFNKFEINNAGSTVIMNSISFASTGVGNAVAATASRGSFEVVDNATVDLDVCTFTDMGTFIFQSNSTLDDCTFRRCELVTGGGAIFTTSNFINSIATSSVLVTNLNQLVSCDFLSDGSNHAVNLSNVTSNITMDWTSTYTNYVAGTTGTNVGVTPTGNETILVNISSGIVLTINASATATVPSVAVTGGGTVNVFSTVTNTIEVVDKVLSPIVGAVVAVYQTSNDEELVNDETDANGKVTFGSGSNIPIYVRVRLSTTGATRYIPVETPSNTGPGLNLTVTLNEDLIAL